jgi:hypothetical protein
MRPVTLGILILHGAGLILPISPNLGTFTKVLASPWMTHSLLEWGIGLGIVYVYEEFERRMGSRKYLSYALVIWAIASTLQLMITRTAIRPGLYPLVFGFMPFFIADIPAQIAYIVFGCKISTKWWMYVLAIQMMSSAYPNSTVTALWAFMAGIIVKARFLPLGKFRIPSAVFKVLEKVCGAILPRNRRVGNQVEAMRMDSVGENFRVDQAKLSGLLALGFNEDDARRALIRANNNLEQASNFLLDDQHKDE